MLCTPSPRLFASLVAIALTPAVIADVGLGVAQTPVDQLGDVLPRLTADDFRVRQAATEEIIEIDGLRLADVEQLLVDPGIPAEARLRLQQIALGLFRVTPKAAMGVSFNDAVREPGVRINTVHEPFPVARVMQPMDVLVEMAGVPVRTNAEMRGLILSHEPGDIVPIAFIRDGNRMTADLELGSFTELGSRGRIDGPSLRSAFAFRLGRTVGPLAGLELAGDGLTAQDWAAAELGAAETAVGESKTWRAFDSEMFVAPGGRARTSVDETFYISTPNPRLLGPSSRGVVVTPQSWREHVELLRELSLQRRRIESRLADEGLPAQVLDEGQGVLEQLDAQIRQTERNLLELRGIRD